MREVRDRGKMREGETVRESGRIGRERKRERE